MYKLILLTGSLILQFAQAYRTHSRIKRKIKLLHTIIEIMPLTPTQILSKFKDSTEAQILSICKGTISAVQKTSSILNPKKQIIYTKLQSSGNNIFSLFHKTLLRTKQASYLKLSDNDNSLNIFQIHKSSIIPTEQIQLKDKRNILQKIKNKIMLMFSKRIPNQFDLIEYSMLNKETICESYLPDNSQCSILGTFVKEDNGVCCYKPLIISPSKERMVAFIQHKSIFYQIQLIMLIILVFGVTGFLIKQIIFLYQRYKNKTHDFMSRLNKIFVKSRICKICNVNLSCILNKQCMHMAICQKCCQQQKQNCIECKKKIKEIVEMHVC